MTERYARRGVSSSKEDVHAAVRHLDQGLYPKAFCRILPDLLTNDPAYCTVMHADGAGTKSALAYVYWRETGDLSVWKGVAQDAIVMNIDDLLCVGAAGSIVMSSAIGRNKKVIPGDVIGAIIRGTEEIADELRAHGIDIRIAGGETADLGDLIRTIVVDNTVVARMHRDEVIDNARIQDGDVIVGLASSGQAAYEQTYNSGIGSNGLTSARHDLFHRDYATRYPESFDPDMEIDLAYSGRYHLTDSVEGQPLNMGQLALSPTRTYAPVMTRVFDKFRRSIHGIVHCTGGGQTKVLHFAENLHVIKDNLFELPPVFRYIREQSQTSWQEMFRVFNMGHRMEIYLAERDANGVMEIARSLNVGAQIIGSVHAADKKKLTISGPDGDIEFE